MPSALVRIDEVKSIIILVHRGDPPSVYVQMKHIYILGTLTSATTKSLEGGTPDGESAQPSPPPLLTARPWREGWIEAFLR